MTTATLKPTLATVAQAVLAAHNAHERSWNPTTARYDQTVYGAAQDVAADDDLAHLAVMLLIGSGGEAIDWAQRVTSRT